ncbi:SgcJ/EcaC family oxidoreductase [Neisseria sp. 23W00296]|uniref:SgcJ/EcaC family oxidoreductase n=1 Tax=unclassified Neisseria TaxID=2623750 RepID=UPI0037570E17
MTRTAVLLLALLAAAPAFAATQTDTAVQTAQSADTEALHNELRTLRDTMQQALNRRDLNTLLAHVADDVVFTTMNGDRVHGKDGIRAYYDKMLGGANPVVQSIEAEFSVEELSHLYHGNTAVAFGSSSDRYRLTGGETWTVEPKWSATLVRQDGRWLIADFHYSVNMFDNPVLAAQRKLLLGGGAAAALAAAAAGFLLGRRGRKKAV